MHPSRKRNPKQCHFPKRNSEVIYKFGEQGKRVDAWKPATTFSTRVRKTVPQYNGWREEGVKAKSFLGLVQVNHLLLQQLIQILVLQHHLPQNGRLQKYGHQNLVETPSKFAISFHVKPIDFRIVTWYMSIFKFALPRLFFEIFRTETKIELFWAILVSSKAIYRVMTFSLCYQGKHATETMY